jgi:hypothetical protein
LGINDGFDRTEIVAEGEDACWTDVLGISDKKKAQKINQRKYVEYLLKNGTPAEKRELLSCLKDRINLKGGQVSLNH